MTSEKYIHGALVEFTQTFLVPLPNVIVFQFNPETITHAWTEAETAATPASGAKVNPLAARSLPGESFTFKLELDSNEMIATGSGVARSIASSSGVYTRLAALEMLQYPSADPKGGLVGAITAGAGIAAGAAGSAVGGALGGAIGAGAGLAAAGVGAALGGSASEVRRPIPLQQVPVVLFVWGPRRIVPVRVTALSVAETLYDAVLNPIHAEVQVTLRVLTPDELKFVSGPLKQVARVAYTYSQNLRQGMALTNLAEATESIIGMLPI